MLQEPAVVVSVHGVDGSLKHGVVVVRLLVYKDTALVRAVVVGDNSKDMTGHTDLAANGYTDRVAAGCCIDRSMLDSMNGYLAIADVPLIDRGKRTWICGMKRR